MKRVFIFTIKIYQKYLASFLAQIIGTKQFCRYAPTCSHYAIESIGEHGILKGGYLSIIRILSCQPFTITQGPKRTFIQL